MDNESSSVLKWTVVGGVCFLIFGGFVIFGESIWAPQSVKIREKAVQQSSTYTEGRIADLRRGSLAICNPQTPKENIPGLIELFNGTADELKETKLPADLEEKIALARDGKSFCP